MTNNDDTALDSLDDAKEDNRELRELVAQLRDDNERLAKELSEQPMVGNAADTVNELRANVRALADNWSKEQQKSEGLGEKVDELGKRRTIILQRDARGDWSIHDYNAFRDQATDQLEMCELLHILAAIVHSEPGQCRFLQGSYSDVRAENRKLSSSNRALVSQTSGDRQRIREYHDALEDTRKRLEEANARVLLVQRETEFAPLADTPEIGTELLGDRAIDTPFFGGEPFIVHRREPDAIKIDEGAIVALANMQPGEKFTVVSALRGLAAFCDNAPAVVGSVLLKGGIELRVADYLRTLDGSTFPTEAQALECAASVKEKTGNECTQVTIGGGFVLPWAQFLALAKHFDRRREFRGELDADLQRMSRELQELGAVNSAVDDLRDLSHDARVDRVNWVEAYRMWLNRDGEAFDQIAPPRPAGLVLKSDTVQGNPEPMSNADLEAAAAEEGFGLVAETIEQSIDAEVAQAFEQGGDPTATSWLSAGYPLFQPYTHERDAQAVFELLGNAKLPLRWLLSIEPAALAEVHAWATGQVEPSPELVRVVLLAAEQLAHEKVAFNIDTGVPHYDADGRCRIEGTLRMLGYVIPEGDAQLWSSALCLALDEYIDAKVDTAAPDVFTARYSRVAWCLDADLTAAGGSGGLADIAPGITVPDATDDELLARQTAGLAEIKAYLDANPEEVRAAMGEDAAKGAVVIGVDLAAEGTTDRTVVHELTTTPEFVDAWPTTAEVDNGGPADGSDLASRIAADGPLTQADIDRPVPVRNIVQAMERDTDGDDCAP